MISTSLNVGHRTLLLVNTNGETLASLNDTWFLSPTAYPEQADAPMQSVDSINMTVAEQGQTLADIFAPSLGGRLYCTAMATLTLEVYYRFMPIYSDIEPDTFEF